MEILTVCTGNICRSPLAAVILKTRLADLDVQVHSAGTRGLNAATMTPEAIDLAIEYGVSDVDADAHRSRYLIESLLSSPDLILTMTRDHRREVAELAPARLRSTFTLREFARLAAALSDEQIAAAAVGDDASTRLRSAATAIAGMRGLVEPGDDDVIDPYRREWEVYRESADQLVPALAQVERVVRIASR